MQYPQFQGSNVSGPRPQPPNIGPGENIRSRLNLLLDKTSGLHGSLDAIIEATFGPRIQEVAGNSLGQGQPTYLQLLDQIDYRLQEIERGIEILSQRL